MLPITAVVCTLNSFSSIEKCLLGLKLSGVAEIIVVDGGSTDGTREFLLEQDIVLLFDGGLGLGAARNMGIQKASEKFILNCGSDNIVTRELLVKMLEAFSLDDLTECVGCRTKVEVKNLTQKMLNIQWSGRITPGVKEVIGTPNIFRTKVLQQYLYSKHRSWSDDEELCTRIKATKECTFRIIDAYCIEVGQDSFARLKYRYLGYGRSDYEVWSAYAKNWSTVRKLKSIRHPYESEFSNIIRNVPAISKIIVLPLLVFSTTFRYQGWIKVAARNFFRP
jgi:glycosyltransferase involved in cell wall biosynthesis